MSGWVCPKCSNPLPAGATACLSCGQPVAIPQAAPPPPAAPRARRIGAFRVLLILVVVFAAVVGISDVIARFRGGSAHCVFGLTGAAVSVSVDGPGALSKCQRVRTGLLDGRRWYVDDSGVEPSGAVICRISSQGDTIVVRDQPNGYGPIVCRAMADLL